MTKLVGIDHRADRLDHAVSDVELDHADHAPFGVVHQSARLAVDPGQPEEAPTTRPRRSRPTSSRMTRCRPASGFPSACAPAAMCCLGAKICRQFTSALPVILATSG